MTSKPEDSGYYHRINAPGARHKGRLGQPARPATVTT